MDKISESSRMFLNLVNLLLLGQMLMFSACSLNSDDQWERSHEFKVTVAGEGVANTLDGETLVHHVQVARADLETVVALPEPLKAMKVKVTPFRDANGGIMGILLDFRDDFPQRDKFLWQHGDMVLAINSDLVDNEEVLKKFFSKLKDEGAVTLSIQREGIVHKFYYKLV